MKCQSKWLLASLLGIMALSTAMVGCSSTKSQPPDSTPTTSVPTETSMLTLEDIDKEDFYPTAKVSYTIEGKMVSQPKDVTNILEGTEYTAQPQTDVILKGTVGEFWVTPLEKVIKTYSKADGSELTASDFTLDTFITLQTKPGNPVFAAFVPAHKQVEIHTAWGDVLIANRPEVEHSAGDYIVCSATEEGLPDFSDVWVVNGKVFETTYDMSQMNK